MKNQQSLGGGAHGFIPLKDRKVGVEPPTYKGIIAVAVGWAFSPTKLKIAFTLAEVLITLGIIGVVAAMTLPTLIQNHNKKVVATQLKQNYSIIAQALTMAQAEYGDPNNWDVSSAYGQDPAPESKNEYAERLGEKYLVPYLKNVKNHGTTTLKNAGFKTGYKLANGNSATNNMPENTSKRYIIEMANGATYFLYMDSTTSVLTSMLIYIDINGKKKPNVYGRDAFLMSVERDGKLVFNRSSCSVDDRECLKRNCLNRYACGQLIMQDGWQISDDYPIKL